MDFNKRQRDGWSILSLPKEINYECSISLKEEIDRMCEKGERKICIDLSSTEYIGMQPNREKLLL